MEIEGQLRMRIWYMLRMGDGGFANLGLLVHVEDGGFANLGLLVHVADDGSMYRKPRLDTMFQIFSLNRHSWA